MGESDGDLNSDLWPDPTGYFKVKFQISNGNPYFWFRNQKEHILRILCTYFD